MTKTRLESENNLVIRVERHCISKEHELFDLIDQYAFKSKNLYNYSNYLTRQTFIITSKLNKNEEISIEQQGFLAWINNRVDEYNEKKKCLLLKAQAKGKKTDTEHKPLSYFSKEHKYLGYNFLEFLTSEGNDYSTLMNQVSQQILRLLDKNWISFFESINDWKQNPTKYLGQPKLPKYKHKTKGRFNIVFTNQNCKIKDGFLIFPRCFNQYPLKTKVGGKLQQVRINPSGGQYTIEIVYEKEIQNKEINTPKRIVGIDLGLDNLVTMTNNIGLLPIVINGKIIKSINQFFNKQTSYYKSILKKETDRDWSRRLQKLTNTRNNKITDFMHKTSRWIVDYCLQNKIDTIVIGNNKNWKQKINIGSKNNQNFVQLPYETILSQLKYKAPEKGIKIIITEESYTSKASFLDNDEIPIYDIDNPIEHKFSGKRIKRGLYKTKNGTLINADVNGSYNILRKAIPEAFVEGIEGVGLHPLRINILKENNIY